MSSRHPYFCRLTFVACVLFGPGCGAEEHCALTATCEPEAAQSPSSPQADAGHAGGAPSLEVDASVGALTVSGMAEPPAGGASTAVRLSFGNCGDATLDPGEACDDGNELSGDGCFGCAAEAGWLCAASGDCSPVCGDAQVHGEEAAAGGCDDGNAIAGDGCSAACTVESGWACSGVPSVCSGNCGNGVLDDAETCDDGNDANADGCQACQVSSGWLCQGQPSVCSDVVDCKSDSCLNGGQCEDQLNGFACRCDGTGFTGDQCEVPIKYCASHDCQNDGRCVEESNGFSCKCTDTDFEGEKCERRVDDCKGDPCQHGGKCEDKTRDFACDCDGTGYEGQRCQTLIPVIEECKFTRCGMACRDLTSDVNNCGACGNSCRAGESCEEGTCVVECQGTLCGANMCVDTTSDVSHCSSCGNECSAPKAHGQAACSRGKCGFDCDGGYPDVCDNTCTNKKTDVSNCGGCGKKCSAPKAHGQAECSRSKCGFDCDGGYPDVCDNTCTNKKTDTSNCGACGQVCPAPKNGVRSCTEGSCKPKCDAGFTSCGDQCYDTESDPLHCGSCVPCQAEADKTVAGCRAGACQHVCAGEELTCGDCGSWDFDLGRRGEWSIEKRAFRPDRSTGLKIKDSPAREGRSLALEVNGGSERSETTIQLVPCNGALETVSRTLAFEVYSDVPVTVGVGYVDGSGLRDDYDGEQIDVSAGRWTKSAETLDLDEISEYRFLVLVESEKDATVYIDNVRLSR